MAESPGPRIPPEIDRFLAACIGSVEELELLLLLQEDPTRAWTADEAARALYSNPGSIAHRLARLHRSCLLVTEEGPGGHARYRFAPEDAPTTALVARLARIYRERRVAVITLLASRPLENIRAFTDAFRLGRKEED
ncbi:MAG TPA: hypothetical protein VFS40_03880 [Gemmatimonadales bacterium]|nr:hypothetical protein [Gemmatimonadales bacterium]